MLCGCVPNLKDGHDKKNKNMKEIVERKSDNSSGNKKKIHNVKQYIMLRKKSQRTKTTALFGTESPPSPERLIKHLPSND